jgi:hypothetical protein
MAEGDEHPGDEQKEYGPLEAALREDVREEVLKRAPRLAAAFERGEAGPTALTPEETVALGEHLVWVLHRHLLALATEVDRLAVEQDGEVAG